MTTRASDAGDLQANLQLRRGELREPALVMRPETLGAARLTRYSFSRTMLRRAVRDGWQAKRNRLELNENGEGEAVYQVDCGSYRFHFVAFTTTLDESEHTDRVIAERWEIAAALVEGDLTADFMEMLRSEVPQQESGRLDPRVLVLTRGNRSVRFFQYLIDCLASGKQPDSGQVADAGYIMRSTAFYGNGKYGMCSFDGYPPGHPFAVSYRAQMLSAWLFRELSYDVVESCAKAQGGDSAVQFSERWRRFFGLGNATGLGLVPYAFKHPQVLNAWAGIRELALADVRQQAGSTETNGRLSKLIERAHQHFTDGSDDDCAPFLNPVGVAAVVGRIGEAFEECQTQALPFDALYRWSEGQDYETIEMTVSLLIELHDGDDELADKYLTVDEHAAYDPAMTVGELAMRIEHRFGWLADLDLDEVESTDFQWVISDNTEEPRRTSRQGLATDHSDVDYRTVTIDIALRLWRLRGALEQYEDGTPICDVLAAEPEHRVAVDRLTLDYAPYGEPRDNACAADYKPLQLQRFQLAMYGMDNFKPKSTDWLRVTLLQGAPRLSDLGPELQDDWVLPLRPETSK